ncbi:oligosaccharide flippase family protein [Candidatus Zixiibacteriota bacterium]
MLNAPVSKFIDRIRSTPLMGEFLVFSTSTILLQASRFGVNLYSARLLGPDTWGLWNILNLSLVYIGVLHLGLINAMNREVPVFRGMEEGERVRLVESVTLGVVLVSAIVVSVSLLLYAKLFAGDALQSPLSTLAPLLFVSLFSIYLQTSLKANCQFHRMSYQQMVFAGLLPLLVIPMVLRFGLSGFIGGQAIVIAVVAVGMMSIWKFNLKPRFNRREMIRLMRIGFPILGVGILYALLTTADRLVILAMLDVTELGYYSLAIMVVGIIGLIPLLVAQQSYPRMAEAWGRTEQVSEVMRWVYRQIVMAMGITIPVVIIIFLAATPFVTRYLPEYVPGIKAMKIIMIGPLFLALAGGFGNLLNTLNRQVWYLIVQGFALLLNVTLNILLVRAGLGIIGVATGTTITYVLYGTTLIVVGYRIAGKTMLAPGETDR